MPALALHRRAADVLVDDQIPITVRSNDAKTSDSSPVLAGNMSYAIEREEERPRAPTRLASNDERIIIFRWKREPDREDAREPGRACRVGAFDVSHRLRRSGRSRARRRRLKRRLARRHTSPSEMLVEPREDLVRRLLPRALPGLTTHAPGRGPPPPRLDKWIAAEGREAAVLDPAALDLDHERP